MAHLNTGLPDTSVINHNYIQYLAHRRLSIQILKIIKIHKFVRMLKYWYRQIKKNHFSLLKININTANCRRNLNHIRQRQGPCTMLVMMRSTGWSLRRLQHSQDENEFEALQQCTLYTDTWHQHSHRLLADKQNNETDSWVIRTVNFLTDADHSKTTQLYNI